MSSRTLRVLSSAVSRASLRKVFACSLARLSSSSMMGERGERHPVATIPRPKLIYVYFAAADQAPHQLPATGKICIGPQP